MNPLIADIQLAQAIIEALGEGPWPAQIEVVIIPRQPGFEQRDIHMPCQVIVLLQAGCCFGLAEYAEHVQRCVARLQQVGQFFTKDQLTCTTSRLNQPYGAMPA